LSSHPIGENDRTPPDRLLCPSLLIETAVLTILCTQESLRLGFQFNGIAGLVNNQLDAFHNTAPSRARIEMTSMSLYTQDTWMMSSAVNLPCDFSATR